MSREYQIVASEVGRLRHCFGDVRGVQYILDLTTILLEAHEEIWNFPPSLHQSTASNKSMGTIERVIQRIRANSCGVKT